MEAAAAAARSVGNILLKVQLPSPKGFRVKVIEDSLGKGSLNELMTRLFVGQPGYTGSIKKVKMSMGLVIKAHKCRSLSRKSEKLTNITFNLQANSEEAINILSVIFKHMKFLGPDLADLAMFARFFFFLSLL